ncbi:hypothetical protein Tcan_09649 [Toxocara canis]|uniref:Uncharacterized protein n=1 Tax=Toxocara canis TaxID=6265 RepID=A0A0B2UZG3_TOXCA|nr:hypothetical protein Tcan_09649 [Toxocara canis]
MASLLICIKEDSAKLSCTTELLSLLVSIYDGKVKNYARDAVVPFWGIIWCYARIPVIVVPGGGGGGIGGGGGYRLPSGGGGYVG